MTPDEIIRKHMGLARYWASELAGAHATNDYDELLSAAYLGLVKAAQAGDDSPAYITARIKGEIVDTMRNHDILSRRDRKILETLSAFNGDLEATAEAASVPTRIVQQRLSILQTSVNISKERATQTYTTNHFDEKLEVCLNLLPEHLHEVFLCYFRDGLSKRETAKHLGKQRVTDEMKEILATLREHSHHLKDLLY